MNTFSGKGPVRMENVPRGHGERVLVVDDDPASLYCIGEMLSRLGYGVTRATSAHSALAVLCNDGGEFDLIITDHRMPEMRGLDLVHAVRRSGQNIPMILTTGYEDLDVYLAVHASHDVLFLRKPMGVRDLGVLVDSALQRRGLSAEP